MSRCQALDALACLQCDEMAGTWLYSAPMLGAVRYKTRTTLCHSQGRAPRGYSRSHPFFARLRGRERTLKPLHG